MDKGKMSPGERAAFANGWASRQEEVERLREALRMASYRVDTIAGELRDALRSRSEPEKDS
jgi:hypothetical protein